MVDSPIKKAWLISSVFCGSVLLGMPAAIAETLSQDTPQTTSLDASGTPFITAGASKKARDLVAQPAPVQSPLDGTLQSANLDLETSLPDEIVAAQEGTPDEAVPNNGQTIIAQDSTPAPESPPATSQPVVNPLAPPPGWRFDFEPYLFVPFKVDGDIFFGRGRRVLFPNRPGVIAPGSGINLSVKQNLSDILDKISNIFGVSGRVQAWNGNFGIVAEGLYINVGTTGSSGGGQFTLRDQFNVTVPNINVDTQNTLASFSLAASYRFVTVPLRTVTDPSNPSNYYPAISFEGLAGARYLSVSQSVDLDPGPDFEVSGSEINPMLGGTVKLMLSDSFAFYFRGDTSNLGGGNLKQYYNLYAGIDWKFSGSFALRLAYRINQIEFVKEGRLNGDNGLNLRTEGVQIGISWQF